MLGLKVIDRTELILDIFARHARTQQARLQVELAQYEYLLPRLARMWKHLERQAGGIGTRGPGETQIETDRRIIRRRIGQLRRELKVIDRRMQTQHKQRRSQFRVALVGYTNAGKSSLMNRLSAAQVLVEDQLFATLDATTRRVETSDGHAFLLTDTVGFIRKLPHHLVESFRATLSEINEADLLFHVVDLSAEDWEGQIVAVDEVLETVHAESSARLMVFNKIDCVDDPDWLAGVRRQYPEAVLTSAATGEGLERLLQHVQTRLRDEERQLVVRIGHGYAKSVARLHELGDVQQIQYEDGHAEIRVHVNGPNYGRVLQLDGIEILEIARRR
jgi:GTP-binding protein HflX